MRRYRLIPDLLLAATLSATLGLAACDSNDDDSGGPNAGGGGPDGMQPGGDAERSSDVLAIVRRPANSDPLLLDETGLATALQGSYGDPDTAEPLVVQDGATALSVLGGQ